jgi:hypothetical protein
MSTIILMEPRRAADCGQQLKFIAEALNLRKSIWLMCTRSTDKISAKRTTDRR